MSISHNPGTLVISSATAQGLRRYQEDRFLIHDNEHGTLLAVIDGHSGAMAADEIRLVMADLWDICCISFDIPYSFTELFKQLDCRTASMNSGAAVSVAFIPKDASVAHIAILGDAPVVAGIEGEGLFIGSEHNVRTNQLERKAAQERGGIYSGGYICCGSCGLQMSRALGDAPLRSILSREPEITLVVFSDFLLLASDGVFDPGHQNTSREIHAVANLIRSGSDAQNIVDRAIKNRTGDNATAILVRPGISGGAA